MPSNEKEFDLWLESHRPPTIYAEWGDLSGNLEDLSSEMHNLRSLFKKGGWPKVRERLRNDLDYFVGGTDEENFDSILSSVSCTKILYNQKGDFTDFFVSLFKFPDINQIVSFIRVPRPTSDGIFPDFDIKDFRKNETLPDVETLSMEDVNDYIIYSYADEWFFNAEESVKGVEKSKDQNSDEYLKIKDETAFEESETIEYYIEQMELDGSSFKLENIIDSLYEEYNKSDDQRLIVNHLKELCRK